jgi:hypothetical protein
MDKNEEYRAKGTAMSCPHFNLDDEDELVSDEPKTCLNCRYRRWTQEPYVCLYHKNEK